MERAKREYPKKEVVQKAFATSTGRRLDVVRMFPAERNLSDLTSLVINKNSGECGAGFTAHFDPKATRKEVFAFDWSTVSTAFDWSTVQVATALGSSPWRISSRDASNLPRLRRAGGTW